MLFSMGCTSRIIPILTGFLLGGGALAQEYNPPPAKEGYSYPECKCSNRGEMLPMGALVCLNVDGKTFLARCEMSLNNPTWRHVQDGCPTASAPSLREGVESVQPS